MSWRYARIAMIALLAIPLVLVACDDDGTSPNGDNGPAAADFSGTWTFATTVTGKRVCTNEIGAEGSIDATITQIGSSATVVVAGAGAPIVLTIAGSSATGGSPQQGFEFDLTIADGEVTGDITETQNLGTPQECTEVSSVVGTRTNDPPAAGFAGYWDLDITVTTAGCSGDNPGESEEVCRQVTVSGNTVTILDEDGPISGVGDGDTAVLSRTTADERLEITITVSPNGVTGTATAFDIDDQCENTLAIEGTRRSSPCPPPPEPGAFVGSWDMTITVTASQCEAEPVGSGDNPCIEVSVDGSSITLDDDSGEGPITGTVDGNTATASRTSESGTLTVQFQVSGDQVSGTAQMVYTSGNCAELTVDYSIFGTRRSTPCGDGGGGIYAGFWQVTSQIVTDTCGGSVPGTDCVEFEQSGNTITVDGAQGTLSGNRLTIREEETDEFGFYFFEVVIDFSGDGNSFTGQYTDGYTDFENSENSCGSVENLSGIRVTDCNSASVWPDRRSERRRVRDPR